MLTGVAAILVLLTLAMPNDLEDLEPDAFVLLPLEPIVYLAVVLVLPDRYRRLRWMLAVTTGAVLALFAVFKVLDIGFTEALNRPFDPLIDWRYAGSFVETVRGSAEGRPGILLLVLAGLLIVALLVLLPSSVLRLTQVATRHRGAGFRLGTALAALWVTLSVLDVRTGAGSVASREAAAYVYGEVSRIPSELRDQREFARSAEIDPVRRVPTAELLTGLRGKDVLFVFVESFGRVAVEGSTFSPGVNEVLAAGTRELERAGFDVERICDFNRVSVPGWWLNGRLLKRKTFSRLQLKLLDTAMPLLRHLDRAWPWSGLSLIACGRRR